MANNETLGASFSIDVTNLKAGLAQANRMIRESESEFKAAAAGMDDWRESQDGLTAKIKSLNSITDAQRAKVKALNGEYDRLIADGLDPASREATELRTKINNETAALKANEAELKKQTKALKEMGNETAETGESVESMGGMLEGLKGASGVAIAAIAAVGTACVGAIGAFLGLAESTREYRREMAQLAQNASDSGSNLDAVKDKLAEVSAVTGDAGAAMEGMNMLMATGLDTSQIEAASDALTGAATRFDGLKFEGMAEGLQETLATGVAVGPFAELIERTGGDLEAFNAQLAGCTTEAERQATAMQFLTKSGLIEANEEYKKMNADLYEAEMAQYNMNDAMAELGAIAEPIMTMLTELATDLLTTIKPFVQLIGEGLAGALSGTEGAAESFAAGLGGLIETVLQKIIDLAPFVIDTAISLVAKLTESLFTQLPNILNTLQVMLVKAQEALGGMLPTLIPIVISAILQLVETALDNLHLVIDAGMTLLGGLADGLVDALPVLIEKIPIILGKLVAAITANALQMTNMGIMLIIKLAVGLIKAIPQLVAQIPTIIAAIVTGLVAGVADITGVGEDFVKGLWDGISNMTDWISKKIKGFGADVLDGIKDFFGIHSPSKVMADEVGKNLALGIGEGFTKNIAGVNKQITGAMNFDGGVGVVGNIGGRTGGGVVVYQTNNYAQAHSRIELYKTKQATAAAVRLAMTGA